MTIKLLDFRTLHARRRPVFYVRRQCLPHLYFHLDAEPEWRKSIKNLFASKPNSRGAPSEFLDTFIRIRIQLRPALTNPIILTLRSILLRHLFEILCTNIICLMCARFPSLFPLHVPSRCMFVYGIERNSFVPYTAPFAFLSLLIFNVSAQAWAFVRFSCFFLGRHGEGEAR